VVGLTGQYLWALWVGWLLTCFGLGLLILLNANTTVAQWIFLEAVSGLGIGLLFPSIALAVQSSVPQRGQHGCHVSLIFQVDGTDNWGRNWRCYS